MKTIERVQMFKHMVGFQIQKDGHRVSILHNRHDQTTSKLNIDGYNVHAPIFLNGGTEILLSAVPGDLQQVEVDKVPTSQILNCNLQTHRCSKLFDFDGIVSSIKNVPGGAVFVGNVPVKIDTFWLYGKSNFYFWDGEAVSQLTQFNSVQLRNLNIFGDSLIFSVRNAVPSGIDVALSDAMKGNKTGIMSVKLNELSPKKPLATQNILEFIRTNSSYDGSVSFAESSTNPALVSYYDNDQNSEQSLSKSEHRLLIWDSLNRVPVYSNKIDTIFNFTDLFEICNGTLGFVTVPKKSKKIKIKNFSIEKKALMNYDLILEDVDSLNLRIFTTK